MKEELSILSFLILMKKSIVLFYELKNTGTYIIMKIFAIRDFWKVIISYVNKSVRIYFHICHMRILA